MKSRPSTLVGRGPNRRCLPLEPGLDAALVLLHSIRIGFCDPRKLMVLSIRMADSSVVVIRGLSFWWFIISSSLLGSSGKRL